MKKIKFKKQDSIITELLTREQLRSILAGDVQLGSGCSSNLCQSDSDCSGGLPGVTNQGICRVCIKTLTSGGPGGHLGGYCGKNSPF